LPNNVVEIRDLRYGWRPGQRLLDLPELTVGRAERVLLHGPSGSGKSTLLGLIAGVVRPSAGSIRLLGQDLGRMSASRCDSFRGEHLGFIFQMFNLVPYLSVQQNVLLPLRFSRARAIRVCEPEKEATRLLVALGLDDPELLRNPVSQLSVGQQQRVAAARAMLGGPSLLVADEPTSALDASARESFLALLMRECLANDTSVIFVSHDPSLSRAFDRSLALDAINRPEPR
jgi:putative ABC transport system ATP-binding protein